MEKKFITSAEFKRKTGITALTIWSDDLGKVSEIIAREPDTELAKWFEKLYKERFYDEKWGWELFKKIRD